MITNYESSTKVQCKEKEINSKGAKQKKNQIQKKTQETETKNKRKKYKVMIMRELIANVCGSR